MHSGYYGNYKSASRMAHRATGGGLFSRNRQENSRYSPIQPQRRNGRAGSQSGRYYSGGKPASSSLFSRFGNTQPVVGAVRVTEADRSHTGFIRKSGYVAAIMAFIGAGVLANNAEETSDFKGKVITQAAATPPMPSFRFDDASNAISDTLPEQVLASMASRNPMKPDLSQGFNPLTVANLIPELSSALGPQIDAEAHQEPNPVHNAEAMAAVYKDDAAFTSIPPVDIDSVPGGIQPFTTGLSRQDGAGAEQALQENYIKSVKIASGDTLSGVLFENGIMNEDLQEILQDKLVKKHLTPLGIGDKFDFEYRWNGDLDNISVKIDLDTRIRLIPSSKGFMTRKENIPIEYERVVTSGTIDQSLYLAAERANLKQSTIMELADIFEWELDFSRDIRKGDSFAIVYDRLYRDGRYLGDGEILAARFRRGDRTYSAIRFEFEDGRKDYFSPDGQSKRKAFMRHPVDVVRITSRFDPNRMHPVLHKIRAHKGVDYGAPHGSPIYAVADGVVEYSGKKSTFGNTVILRHGDNRTTLYAHMSKIAGKSKNGKRVNRGDVIGYVGRTGRVTGTHLHYEFRINGKHVDPLKIELPSGKPLPKKYLVRLKSLTNELFTQMDSVVPAPEERVALSQSQ